MNEMLRKRALSAVAATMLCGTMAFAGAIDYNGSVASPCQVGSCKDTNTTIAFKGDQGVKVENVYVTLNDNNTTAEYNLTAGNKIFIELPDASITFATEPYIVANQYAFTVNGSAAHKKKATLVTDPDTGKERAEVTIDRNLSSGTEVVFENIELNIPSTYTGDLNVTFGSVRVSDGIPDKNTTVQPLVAIVKSSFAKNPIVTVNGNEASDDNTPVVMPRVAGETQSLSSTDNKSLMLLFKVDNNVASGSVIDLKLPSWAKMVSYPSVGVLTDEKDLIDKYSDGLINDANATDITASVSGADNNNTIRITLSGDTQEVTELNMTLKLSDINITSTQPDGTLLDVTIDGNATLVGAPSTFTLAKLKSRGLVIDVNESADRNLTRGALHAAPMNPITVKTNFAHDWNDTNLTIALPTNAKFGDLNLSNINVSNPTTLANALNNIIKLNNGAITISADMFKAVDPDLKFIELNLSKFDGNTSITIEANTSVADAFSGNKLPVTLKLTNANDTIVLRDLPAVTANDGANVVDGSVTLETNESDKRVGTGSTNILRLDINESRYGSLQMINDVPTRYFVRSVSCAKINEPGTSTLLQGTTRNGLTFTSGVGIDDSTYRYTQTDESKGQAGNGYVDLNITVPSSCQVGDEVKVKLEREDGTSYGEVKLATIGIPAEIKAVEQNITIANEIPPQTLGTINIKEGFAGALTQNGAFTIIVPSGMQNAKADVTGSGVTIESNSTGLDGRAIIAKVATNVDANITIQAEVGNLLGVQSVEIKDGNASSNYSNKAGVPNKSVPLTYVTTDGTIPAPTLTAEGNTTVQAGQEANITLNCQGHGGETTITLDNTNAPHISLVNGNIVHVAAEATAGEEASATCTESFAGKTSDPSNAVVIKVVQPPLQGSLTIVQGRWNLITTPVPAPMPKSKLDSYTSYPAFAYDSTQNTWTHPDTLNVGKGYWIFADKQGGTLTYTYTGQPTVANKSEQWTLIQNNIVTGAWNLLGTSFDTNVSEIAQTLGVPTSYVFPYDATANNWYHSGPVKAGQGFYVFKP